MKRLFVIAAIMSLFCLVSCEKTGNNVLVGTWKATTMEMNIEGIDMNFELSELGASIDFTFEKDGTGETFMSMEGETKSESFEYEAKNNILYIDFDGFVEKIPYSISNNTMTMTLEEGFIDDFETEVRLRLKKI